MVNKRKSTKANESVEILQKQVKQAQGKLEAFIKKKIVESKKKLEGLRLKKNRCKEQQKDCKQKCKETKQANKATKTKRSTQALKKATLAYEVAERKLTQIQLELAQTKKMLGQYQQDLVKFKSEKKALAQFEKEWRLQQNTQESKEEKPKVSQTKKPVSRHKALSPRVIELPEEQN